MTALLTAALLALGPAGASSHPLTAQEAGARDTTPSAADTVTSTDTGTVADTAPSGLEPTDTIAGTDDEPAVVPGETAGLGESLERLRESVERVGQEAVRAARDLALVVHDDYRVDESQLVDGNVALVGGDLSVAGTVAGDILLLDGELRLESSSRVTGDVIQVGGTLVQSGGAIAGQIVSVGTAAAAPPEPSEERTWQDDDDDDGDDDDDIAFVPPYRPDAGPFWDLWRNIGNGIAGLFTTAGFFLLFALTGIATIALVPDKFHVAADTTRHSFGRSFLVGLAGQFLFLPAIVALGLGIITAVLIPFFILAVCLAHLVGYVAAGQAAGEALARRDPPWRENLPFSGRYEHLLTGLLLLLGLFAVCAVLQIFGGFLEFFQVLALLGAMLVAWIATTAGFGAILLSRGGTRREWALPSRESGVDPRPAAAQPSAGEGGATGRGAGSGGAAGPPSDDRDRADGEEPDA